MIEVADIQAVERLIKATADEPFVQDRLARNVEGPAPEFDRDEAWRVLAGCLLTSQQRSSPGSPVRRLLEADPFPLPWDLCVDRDAERRTSAILSKFGGIRFSNVIASRLATNAMLLEEAGWVHVEREFEELRAQRARAPEPIDAAAERIAADRLSDMLIGIGPKQARNFWQWLGLARYEIPIDSRFAKWLSANIAFPIDVETDRALLANRNTYEIVLSGIQALCRECHVLPCILDAAVFTTFD